MNMVKNNLKFFIGIFIGILISGDIVGAAILINSNQVKYVNNSLESNNVEEALNKLYEKSKSGVDKTITKLYEKSVTPGTGENLNINYTIPENTHRIIIIIAREFAACTFQTVSITGEGLLEISQSFRSAQGSLNPYNYLNIYELKVNPGKTINIKTNDTNLTNSGNYSSYVYAIY